MSKKPVTVVIDRRRLDSLLRSVPGDTDRVVREAAFDLLADMQTHFNEQSPAPAGEPPGVRTGNLRASLTVAQIRQALWELRVGAEYGVYLEFGTPRMAARPFVRPSVWRLAQRYPRMFKVIVG